MAIKREAIQKLKLRNWVCLGAGCISEKIQSGNQSLKTLQRSVLLSSTARFSAGLKPGGSYQREEREHLFPSYTFLL